MHPYWAYLTQQWTCWWLQIRGSTPPGAPGTSVVGQARWCRPANTSPPLERYRQRTAAGSGQSEYDVLPDQEKTLRSILDALADMPVDGVVTTGDAVDPKRLQRPHNVEVRPFLSHEHVMPAVDLVISHGGHSTTMRALSHDLPLDVVTAV